jgi:hypothetical protein
MSPISPSARLRGFSTAQTVKTIMLTTLSLAAAACQTTPSSSPGFLSSYEGLGSAKPGSSRLQKKRDEARVRSIARVYIEPSVLRVDAGTPLRPEEQAMVQAEVDRQLCYQVSERFDLAPAPAPDVARLRTAIVGISPTGRAGSAVSAAAGFFIPVPFVKFRAPMSTGGLAMESEILAADGGQAAALTWSRSAQVVGKLDPSLSPVGDALQLAKPFGRAVRDTFTIKPKKKRAVPDPDPCALYGPRKDAGRFVKGMLVNIGTGLYVPSVTGAGRPAEAERIVPAEPDFLPERKPESAESLPQQPTFASEPPLAPEPTFTPKVAGEPQR